MHSLEIITAIWAISIAISLFLKDKYDTSTILFAILGGPFTAILFSLFTVFDINSSKETNCETKYNLTQIIVEYDKFLNACNNKNISDEYDKFLNMH